MTEQKIVPNLWFDTQAEEAAQYYIDVFGFDLSEFPDAALEALWQRCHAAHLAWAAT